MGFVKKHASDLNDTRKSIWKETERAVKNPDVWKAAALVAAPYAIGAFGPAAGTGFFSQSMGGLNMVGGGIMKGAGLAKNFVTGLMPGGPGGPVADPYSGLLNMDAMDVAGFTPGMPETDPTGGFFSGLMDKAGSYVKGMTGDMAEKIKDPKYMMGLIQRAGSHIAGSKLAGDGLSDDERALMKALGEDLKTLRSQDAQLFDTQMNLANQIIQEGRQIDPEQVGLKAQRDVQIAGGVQMREADREAKMREGGRGLSAADRRRAGLDITRRGQSAYLEGLESGQDKRLKTIATGAGLVPENAPRGALAGGLDLAGRMDIQEDRRRQAAKDTGTLIQDVFGHDKAESTGDLDLEDAIPNT